MPGGTLLVFPGKWAERKGDVGRQSPAAASTHMAEQISPHIQLASSYLLVAEEDLVALNGSDPGFESYYGHF